MIKNILKKCEGVFDIHQTRRPAGDFIVCEPGKSTELAKNFSADYILQSGTIGCTDQYMDSLGRVGICYEAGCLFDDNQSENIKRGFNESQRFLRYFGMIESEIDSPEVSPIVIKAIQDIRLKTSFIVNPEVHDFQKITKGLVLGGENKEPLIVEGDWIDKYILFPRTQPEAGKVVFSLGERVE